MAAFPSSGEFFMGVIPVLNNLFKYTPLAAYVWASLYYEQVWAVTPMWWFIKCLGTLDGKSNLDRGYQHTEKKNASVNQLLITQLPSVA